MAKDRRDVLALDLAIFSLARDHAGHFGYSDTGCTIRITDRNEPSGLTGIPASSAVTELEQQRASLPNDWASEEDSLASRFRHGRIPNSPALLDRCGKSRARGIAWVVASIAQVGSIER